MDVLDLEGAAVSGTGENGPLPQPNGEGLEATQGETPALASDPLEEPAPDVGSDADTRRRPPENGVAALDTDEPLDPELERLFREANAEAQESVVAAELPDIPIQDLLNELMSLSRSLGIEPAARTEPAAPTSEKDWVEPEHPPHREAARVPLFGSRRHALHGLLLSLTLAMAIASILIGADRMVSSGQNPSPTPRAVATTPSGVAVRQVHPGQTALEPTPEATPAPTATRQPAYFMYTVQRGDTLTAIAAAFGLSLDHIIWANPETIDDPDLLLVGDRLLIPSVAGMIYFIKPGDILSAVGRLLPTQEPGDSDLPSGQPEPPR